jgi:hypothetical protein
MGNLGGFVAPNLETAIDSASGGSTAGLITLGLVAALGSRLSLRADAVRREPAADLREALEMKLRLRYGW